MHTYLVLTRLIQALSHLTGNEVYNVYRKLKLLSFLGLFCCFITVKKSMEWKKLTYLKFIFIILFLALYIQLHDLYFALKTNCLHYRNIGQNFSFLYMPQIHVATMYYFIMFIIFTQLNENSVFKFILTNFNFLVAKLQTLYWCSDLN